MFKIAHALALAVAIGLPVASQAETVSVTHGGDTYVAGEQLNETVDAKADAFLAGRTIEARGRVDGDLHVSGFDLSISTDTDNDLYAAGATIVVRGNVAEDLTAAGFSIRTEKTSVTQGNVRLFGNSVTVDGPIEGALMVTARDVILNAPIQGDVRITAGTLTFGPDGKIDGTLTYSTKERIAVPERVAPKDRVVYEPLTASRLAENLDAIGKELPGLPTFASMLAGFLISLFFFLVLGALMLGFMPKRLATLRRSIAKAPGQSILLGVIGLSILFGMILVTALTVVGLPFVPILILSIVVVWTLGYALGAYGVAMRVWSGFGGADDPSNVTRLMVFAAAITAIALLNYIPFVGWVANYTLVLLGVGAMTRALFLWLAGNPDVVFNVDLKADNT
ncbi:hypothetical protein [Aestuariivita boseongensis]|uniref:hypothetical protein n=1 Tax=Aestuariivita boseongensis TaxID=1470562 RepID=UPI0006820D83|nr:hypothetical protein [Aestuariivita boseongensis]